MFKSLFEFQGFRDIAIQPSKETKKAPKGAPREPKMTPRSAPGRPGSDPRRHHELPGTPQERPRSAPRETKSRPRGPGDPRSAPRAPQDRPKSNFGAFLEPPGSDFLQIFEHFGAKVKFFLIPPTLLFCSGPLVLVLGAAQLIRVGGCPR